MYNRKNHNPLKINTFNGYHLEYHITQKFFDELKIFFKTSTFYFYKKNSSKPVLCRVNDRYLIPIGLFSNKGFVLQCQWTITDRKFSNQMLYSNLIKSSITLLPVQDEIIKEFLIHSNNIKKINQSPIYINLVGECSIGKTIMAIHIMYLMKLKTLIILPSLELSKQWKQQIDTYLSHVNCYASLLGVKKFLTMDKKALNNIDILCIPSKHLSNKEFKDYITQEFSICIIDEQHGYNLETHEVMQHFFTYSSFSMCLSLTATPRLFNSLYLGREINLKTIIEQYTTKNFKKIAYEIQLPLTNYKYFVKPDEYDAYKKQKSKQNSITKDTMYYLLNLKKQCISKDQNRINTIVKQIVQSYIHNIEIENPKILILTTFVREINEYYTAIINELKYCLDIELKQNEKIHAQCIRPVSNEKKILNPGIKTSISYDNLLPKSNMSSDFITKNIENNLINPDVLENDLGNSLENTDIKSMYDETKLNLIRKYNNLINNIFEIYAQTENQKSRDNILSNLKPKLINLDKYIIIGTDAQLGTGIDIKELNILHLIGVPNNERNITQYAGRISRNNPTDIHILYYYNINSYQNNIPRTFIDFKYPIDIKTQISLIRKTLMEKNWECMPKEIKI